MAHIISLDNLARAVSRFKAMFVAKEFKTGSTTEYKVLSDNNLTDALVDKINNAGDSTFSGAYSALTGKPSIGGKEVKSGDQTAASLGLEAAGAAAAARTGAVDDVKKLGYQTASDVDKAVGAKGYQTASQVTAAVTAGTKDKVTMAQVEAKGYLTADSIVYASNDDIDAIFG